MGLFRLRKSTAPAAKITVFIVEDNVVYARQLELFLKNAFGKQLSIQLFPVSEVLAVKLERGHIPDVVIMDHFLNDKYEDASSGIEALKEIRYQYPDMLLILHTADSNAAFSVEDLCEYVPKNERGFTQLESVIRSKIST